MKFTLSSSRLIAGLMAASSVTDAALTVNLDSQDSIRQTASQVAHGMVSWYTGNRTGDVPGNLPAPYYWWEAGAMFGALIDYWYYTGDTSYNDITTQALLWQAAPSVDFMPVNQSKTLGNDDQSFWALAAMSAAEVNFPNPPADKPQWLALAQAVFHTQAPRWDNDTCGGGLRWQIFPFNNGYNYKNTISNGCFFNIAARLGRYTGNQTYIDWAEKTWDWISNVGLMSPDYHFYDGSDDTINCTKVDHVEWTYNSGVFLHGAAVMWNVTQNPKWKTRIAGIEAASAVFFTDEGGITNTMTEVACESNGLCNVDQRSFKAYLSRWMAASVKMAPFVADWVLPRLKSSAQAAVGTCTGGADGNQCGSRWYVKGNDGNVGVGEQMSVLEVLQSNLITTVAGPLTNATGGTSKGDYNAGTGGGSTSKILALNAVTTADRAGAGIVTAIVLFSLFGGGWWMAKNSDK